MLSMVLGALAGAAAFFAMYTIPFKKAISRCVDSSTIVAWMTVGAFGTVVGLFLIRRGDLSAMRRIGLAVTWPIGNLNTVVAVLAGIIFFREIDLRRHSPGPVTAVARGDGERKLRSPGRCPGLTHHAL